MTYNTVNKEPKSHWKIILTTRSGNSFELISEVPVAKEDAISNALSELLLKVMNSVDEKGDKDD